MKIEHVAFNVPDPVAAAQWHEEHLGLRIVRTFGAPNHARFLADDSGQSLIEIYHNPSAPLPDYRAMNPLMLHLAFAVDDVALARARLLKAGATAEGEATVSADGDHLAMLRDPWGFPIQLVTRAKPML